MEIFELSDGKPFEAATDRVSLPAIAALVLHHRQLGAARNALERRAAHEHLGAVVGLERCVGAFDVAVGDVDDRVLHDDAGSRCDDVTVGDEHLAAAAHRDGIAVDVDVAIVELQHAAAFADERIDGAASGARCVLPAALVPELTMLTPGPLTRIWPPLRSIV